MTSMNVNRSVLRSLLHLFSPEVVALCYREGSDIVTIPPGVFDRMYESVLTREGLAIFQKDWDSINK